MQYRIYYVLHIIFYFIYTCFAVAPIDVQKSYDAAVYVVWCHCSYCLPSVSERSAMHGKRWQNRNNRYTQQWRRQRWEKKTYQHRQNHRFGAAVAAAPRQKTNMHTHTHSFRMLVCIPYMRHTYVTKTSWTNWKVRHSMPLLPRRTRKTRHEMSYDFTSIWRGINIEWYM